MLGNTGRKRLSVWLFRVSAAFITIALLASSLPQNVSAAPLAKKKECQLTHNVLRGHTLNSIGNYYGVAANQIVKLNDMKSPYTIYVGQKLCIPLKYVKKAPKLTYNQANAPAVYFTAGRAEDEILLYTYNYPKTTVVVKADDAGDSNWKLYTVGAMNIARMGNKKPVRFKLPSKLRDARYLLICLKDKKTRYLQCVYPRSGP